MRALGTEVTVRGVGADAARADIARLEALLTRFRPSPLTRLNQCGELLRPPRELVAALRHALRAAAVSGGLVTPLVLPALRHAGYDRSWPDVAPPRAGPPPPVAPATAIEVGPNRITLPAGAELDLGGTAKGWIVERVAHLLHGEFVIDAGGDVLIDRHALSAVEVEPPTGTPALQLVLPPGRWGVATSSLTRRAWPGGHHLIDPRTARPAASPWLQVTVVRRSLAWAEVETKRALLGAEASPGAFALAFDRDGDAWLRAGGNDWRRHGYDPPLVAA